MDKEKLLAMYVQFFGCQPSSNEIEFAQLIAMTSVWDWMNERSSTPELLDALVGLLGECETNAPLGHIDKRAMLKAHKAIELATGRDSSQVVNEFLDKQ